MNAAEPDWVAEPVPTAAYSSTTSGSRPLEEARIHSTIEALPEPEALAFTPYFDGTRLVGGDRPVAGELPITEPWPGLDAAPEGFQAPEDRGHAVLSPMGHVEYVEDLVRPGRILIAAAEEGTGKTVSIVGELAIRFAVAGGSFAGTWPVVGTGGALVLSEQHPDDDHRNEEAVLAALGCSREQLVGRYFRLPTMTAAGTTPPLMHAEWRTWVGGWMVRNGVRLLVVDTATGATNVEPWGKEMQEVYRGLRRMTEDLPEVAIVLLLHLKKPSGKGERRISDVLGEWGRWCDVVLLIEDDGDRRVKLTTRKRVRVPRRIVATQRDYLLVDPIDLAERAAAKVPTAKTLAAIGDRPGISYQSLSKVLGVSKATAARYVKALGDAVTVVAGSRTSPAQVYLKDAGWADASDAPRPDEGASLSHGASRAGDAPVEAPRDAASGPGSRVGASGASPPRRGDALRDAPPSDPGLTGSEIEVRAVHGHHGE